MTWGQVGGPGPQKPAGDEQRFAQGRGGHHSEWEAIVLTQPVVLCPRTALAAVSAQSISQQPLCWMTRQRRAPECPGGEPVGGHPPPAFAVAVVTWTVINVRLACVLPGSRGVLGRSWQSPVSENRTELRASWPLPSQPSLPACPQGLPAPGGWLAQSAPVFLK